MAKMKKDQFSNVAYGQVTTSAANTLTFSQIQLAVGIFQGVGIVLHRMLYQVDADALREIVAATDSLEMALVSSNRLASIYEVSDPAIIDYKALVGVAPSAYWYVDSPLINDFTMLPGGGKILAANPLFVGVMTQGFVAVATIRVQMEFTFIELADKDYIELIQSQLPANL